MYRIRKFARRHRVGVAAAALLLLSIVAGGIVAAVGFGRAVRSERVAQREAESARQVADFLVNLFDASTPDRSFGETITARTLLDLGARRVDGDAIDDPLVRARLLSTLASAHGKLGLFEEAVELERNAVQATRSAVSQEGPELARELTRLAEIQRSAGKSAEADSAIDRSIEILTRTSRDGSVDLASALHQKSVSLRDRGDHVAADSTIRIAIRMVESRAHPDSATLASLYNTKAGIAAQLGDLEEEERDFVHALSLAIDAHGERHSQVLVIHRNLARLYAELERFEEATRHSDEALHLARVMFPAEHPYVAAAMLARADILRYEQKWAEAAVMYEEAITIMRKSYSGDHPFLASQLYTLAGIYESDDRLDLAIARMSECVAMRSRIHGPENPRTAESQTSLARFYQLDAQEAKADSIYRAALPNLERAIKSRPHAVAYAYMGYANLCRDAGRLTEADTLYTRAGALIDTTSAVLLGYYAECIADHGYLRSLQGRHVEAESTLQVGLELYRRADGEDAAELANPYFLWAVARARNGDADGAIDLLGRALDRGYPAVAAAKTPELAALRSRPDYPAKLRALSAK
jgi:tetratricopeptide (TPR) repeat protein